MRMDPELLVLDADAVRRLIDPVEVIDAVEQSFKLHSSQQGRSYPVVREALHNGGIFGVKAGGIEPMRVVGLKAAGFWGSNRGLGKDAHQATVLLVDPETGRAFCLLDGNQITTVRTGAAGGIGIRLLAAADAERICVFGTGVQAKVQLEFALRARPSVTHVQYNSADGKPDFTFEQHFKAQATLTHSVQPNDAVAWADIVITATPGKAVLFAASAIRAGTHFNCVGADTKGKREAPAGLLTRAQLFTDDITQARELGELQWESDLPATEIGELLLNRHALQRGSDDITVFDMTGLALQDLVVADRLYEKALTHNIGHRLAWPW